MAMPIMLAAFVEGKKEGILLGQRLHLKGPSLVQSILQAQIHGR